MASNASPSLPHRTVSTIRTSVSAGTGVGSAGAAASSYRTGGQAAPTTPGGGPHTPVRTTPSAFSSPSALRAEEETIVIEVGARYLRIGLAGDVVCRGTVAFGPDQQRRVGDLRVWQEDYQYDWRRAGEDGAGRTWDTAYELWQMDVRNIDAGLISDKLERALREAFTKRMVAVLPPSIPHPLLSTTLDTIFGRFQSPSVSLLSAPVAAAVAAGLRSALVVDLGWAETVVTSVYEYREVSSTRSVRAGRLLIQSVHDLLAGVIAPEYQEKDAKGRPVAATPSARANREHVLSFDECEDVAARLVWCRQTENGPSKNNARPAAAALPTEGVLATVAETDETEEDGHSTRPGTGSSGANGARTTSVPLRSCSPPKTLSLSFDQLAEPCETTFFGGMGEGLDIPASWDDEELPIPLLIFRHLQHLSVDVRAVCMARIIFVGGCTGVLGLRGRIFDEVARLIDEQGWEGVRGKGFAQYKASAKLQKKKKGTPNSRKSGRDGASDVNANANADGNGSHPISPTSSADSAESADGVWHDAANARPEIDPVEEELRKTRMRSDSTAPAVSGGQPQQQGHINGQMRAAETLGAWSGASLLAQLRVPALAVVDKEQWTQQGGVLSAVRPSDVDAKQQMQRQSMGHGGLLRSVVGGGLGGASGSGTASWTLGSWGVV
ncbi:uncharacterized protein SPSK_08753 [Sporothrix schenckii 1099-18]|uniref:Actin-related protein n=1 Tax=Sporothrix schenckii 1099-18 TaxID=1397361 RepID=A0A0F2M8J0_SPOSC|nr:uncharacterized protein SPSK_08753 [Sporothrix schenckii 1099-18]KJR85424.1 hypothetical protein SPSK_08753 [Sporothrix schenckii 1099-18]